MGNKNQTGERVFFENVEIFCSCFWNTEIYIHYQVCKANMILKSIKWDKKILCHQILSLLYCTPCGCNLPLEKHNTYANVFVMIFKYKIYSKPYTLPPPCIKIVLIVLKDTKEIV